MGEKISNKRNRGNASSEQRDTTGQGRGAIPKNPRRSTNTNSDTEPRIVGSTPKRGGSTQPNESAGTQQEQAVASSQAEGSEARNSVILEVIPVESVVHNYDAFQDDMTITTAQRQKLRETRYGEFMHVVCHYCLSNYSDEKPPIIQKCGISLCASCNVRKIQCSICCPDGAEDMIVVNEDLNKDLLCNMSLILTTDLLQRGKTDTINATLSKLTLNDDIIRRFKSELVNVSNILNKLDCPLINCAIELGNVRNSCAYWENISSILNTLARTISSRGKDPVIAQKFRGTRDKLKERCNLGDFQDMRRMIDSLLYDVLTSVIPNKDIYIGMRTLDFDAYKLQVSEYHTDFYCIAARRDRPREAWLSPEQRIDWVKERKRYHVVTFYKTCFYVGNARENLDYPDQTNCLMVDYQKLVIGHSLQGAFFVLKMDNVEGLHCIEVNFQPSLSERLKKQIILLCSGEQGPTYKDCKVHISKHKIFINCRINEASDVNNDIISNIPDDSAPYIVPTKGSVIAAREDEENQTGIIIIREVETDEPQVSKQNLIGNVTKVENLSNLSKGRFYIKKCGLIFNIASGQVRSAIRGR